MGRISEALSGIMDDPSIIKVTFNYTEFEIDLRAVTRFRPATKYERDNIGHEVLTRISYLFAAYVNEDVHEIAERIAETPAAPFFGYLTQPDNLTFGFRGPLNSAGPVPIDKVLEHEDALSGVIINRRLRKVRESAEEVKAVLENCGGIAVPVLPNSVDVEGWHDADARSALHDPPWER